MTGQERRQQLLDIGRRLFAERGFEGTSIEEIAAQAGVSKPVVYEHFGGKEGLYAVVVDREVERLTTVTMLLFEKLGWAHDVRWPDEARLNAKRATNATRSLGGMTKRNDKAAKPVTQADRAAA